MPSHVVAKIYRGKTPGPGEVRVIVEVISFIHIFGTYVIDCWVTPSYGSSR